MRQRALVINDISLISMRPIERRIIMRHNGPSSATQPGKGRRRGCHRTAGAELPPSLVTALWALMLAAALAVAAAGNYLVCGEAVVRQRLMAQDDPRLSPSVIELAVRRSYLVIEIRAYVWISLAAFLGALLI